MAISPGTVLGLEDDSAVAEWEALLRQTLNPSPMLDALSPAGEEAGPSHLGRTEGPLQRESMRVVKGGDLNWDHILAEGRVASPQTQPPPPPPPGSAPVRYVRVAS